MATWIRHNWGSVLRAAVLSALALHIPFILGAIGHYWELQAKFWGLQ